MKLAGIWLSAITLAGCGGGESAPSTQPSTPNSTTNGAPIARAGSAQSVSVGTVVTLDGSASNDPDGDTLSYTWSWVTQPAGSNVSLSNANVVRPTFTPSVTGNYVLQLIVSDGKASSTATTVSITVTNSSVSAVPACPTDISTPLFSVSPVALNDFIAFRPLGFVSPPIHMLPAKHSSFSMTPLGQTPIPKPVVAPGQSWVTEIYEAAFASGARNYQVFIRPCAEVRAYFGHVLTISDKLRTEFQSAAATCYHFGAGASATTVCRRENLAIPLAAGEQFGTGPDTAGVDFGTLDFRRSPSAFAKIEHYDYYYRYYTSPLDYFTADTRAMLEGKTGEMFGARWRVASPIGGEYMQDIAGTAQGSWFTQGQYHSNSTDLSSALSLVYDYVDPSFPIMVVGNTVTGLSMGLYSFNVAHSGNVNRRFNDVSANGQVYCFDNFLSGKSPGSLPLTVPNGSMLFALSDSNSLQLEFVGGSSCAALTNRVLSSGAARFER